MVSRVDQHCHILPAVDDGSETIANSLEMRRRGQAEGIRIAALMPHLHPHDDTGKEARHRQLASDHEQLERLRGQDLLLQVNAHQRVTELVGADEAPASGSA